MRLAILDRGHGFGMKALFALIRAFSRQPVLDMVKQVKYRPDFYGKAMQKVTHEAMRGPSAWSVGDRELMAAYVSKMNECEFCVKAHTAVAVSALATCASTQPTRPHCSLTSRRNRPRSSAGAGVASWRSPWPSSIPKSWSR